VGDAILDHRSQRVMELHIVLFESKQQLFDRVIVENVPKLPGEQVDDHLRFLSQVEVEKRGEVQDLALFTGKQRRVVQHG